MISQLVGVDRAILSDPEGVKKVRLGQMGNIRPYLKEHEAVLW
jgi:hypothetical protein